MPKKKVWVIDLDEPLGRTEGPRTASAQSRSAAPISVRVGPVPDRTGRLILLAYALGPLAPVVMRQGRASIVWGILGWAGVPVWTLMLWRWQEIAGWIEGGKLPFQIWLVGMGVLALLGILAWSRAVYLAGGDARFFPERMSEWFLDPRIVGFLALVVPGSGLLLTGASRRAALAVCNAGIVLVATWLLWHGPWLWRCNRSVADGIAPGRMEYLLLAALGVACLGGLLWIAGALDAVRRARERWAWESDLRGDWSAIALLVAFLAFFVTVRPSAVAQGLDGYARRLHRAGFHIVPLHATVLAMRLDSGQPGFALHAAQLYEAAGRSVEAELIRAELRRRWQEYSRLLHPELPDPQVPLPLPIPADSNAAPAAGLESRPPDPSPGAATPGASAPSPSSTPGVSSSPTAGSSSTPSNAGSRPASAKATSPLSAAPSASARPDSAGAPAAKTQAPAPVSGVSAS